MNSDIFIRLRYAAFCHGHDDRLGELLWRSVYCGKCRVIAILDAYSLGLDGIAYAAEALVGRAKGGGAANKFNSGRV